MLPDHLDERIRVTRHHLARLCPAVASIKIRMETQAIGTLVERRANIGRALRLIRLACLDYLNRPTGEKEHHGRVIAKLLDKLETALADARPSEVARRLGKHW